jgi:hypothetical protein
VGRGTVITTAARHVLLGVVLFAVLGLAPGLASALATSPSPSPAGERIVLRVGWLSDPENLNPFVFAPASASELRLLNYDSLVGLDAATLTPMKGAESTGLATDWSISPDGKTWTFTLRDDAAWQDGHGPVTARDVAGRLLPMPGSPTRSPCAHARSPLSLPIVRVTERAAVRSRCRSMPRATTPQPDTPELSAVRSMA